MHPLVLRDAAECVPLAKRMQAAHFTHDHFKAHVDALLFLTLLVRHKCFLPPLELLEPRLFQVYLTISLRLPQYSKSRIRLLQLIVDRYERLNRRSILLSIELELLVVQRFGKSMALASIHAQSPDINRQSLVIMLHELR